MKRSVALIVALVFALSLLAGCGSESEKTDTPATTATAASAPSDTPSPGDEPKATPGDVPGVTPTATPAPTQTAAPNPTVSPSETEPETEEEETEPNRIGVGFVRGKWTGNSFNNSWCGMKFSRPDGWIVATEEEIAALMGIAVSSLEDDSVDPEELASVFDFMVCAPDDSTNIILVYQNLLIDNATDISAEEYLRQVMDQTVPAEDDGYAYSVSGPDTVTLSGRDFARIGITMEGLVSQYYYARRVGDYMACVIITDSALSDPAVFESYFN